MSSARRLGKSARICASHPAGQILQDIVDGDSRAFNLMHGLPLRTPGVIVIRSSNRMAKGYSKCNHKTLTSAAIAPTATTIMVPSLIVMRYSRSFRSRATSERIYSILTSSCLISLRSVTSSSFISRLTSAISRLTSALISAISRLTSAMSRLTSAMSRFVAMFCSMRSASASARASACCSVNPSLLEAFGELEGIEGYGAHAAGSPSLAVAVFAATDLTTAP